MSNFLNTVFGPLDKGSCVYFLIVCGIFYIALILLLVSEIIYTLKHFKNLNFRVVSNGVLLLFNIFLAYFVNRLLYTMCTKSLA